MLYNVFFYYVIENLQTGLTMTRLKDIAEKAGVSIRTVNRVLKNQPNVKQHIVDNVKKIAEELHYYPNLTAQSLKNNTNNDIILFTPSMSILSQECITGIENSVKSNQLNLKINFNLIDDNLKESVKNAFAQKPKGVIFYNYKSILELLKLNIFNIPYVVLEGGSPLINSIDFDRSAGIKESILYLYQKGARKIAYLGFNEPITMPSKDRLEGYLAGLKECGLKPIYLPLPKGGERQFELSREVGRNFKNLKPLPDAVQCYSDFSALGFMAGLNDSGNFVKDTVKVVGFNNAVIARTSSPPLTTVALPYHKLGTTAVEAILNNYPSSAKKKSFIQLKLKTFLEIRETT